MEAEHRLDEEHRGSHHASVVIGVERIEQRPGTQPQLWAHDPAHVALRVDLAIYSLETVFRAAYKLTDRAYFFVATDEGALGRACSVFLAAKDAASSADPLVCELANELLDQQVREQLEKQFGDIRTLIVAQAFSEGNLLSPEPDGIHDADPRRAGGNE